MEVVVVVPKSLNDFEWQALITDLVRSVMNTVSRTISKRPGRHTMFVVSQQSWGPEAASTCPGRNVRACHMLWVKSVNSHRDRSMFIRIIISRFIEKGGQEGGRKARMEEMELIKTERGKTSQQGASKGRSMRGNGRRGGQEQRIA